MTVFSLIAREGRPSLAPAIIGVVITAVSSIAHTVLCIHYKSWFFYLMVLSAILQGIGFSTRLAWIVHQSHDGPLYVSYLIMVVTPSLMVAACHMTFGRVLSCTKSSPKDSKLCWMPIRLITPIFVTLDITAMCFQLLGGSMTVAAYIDSADPANPNSDILTTGLLITKWTSVVQTIYLGLFAVTTIHFMLISHSWNLKRKRFYLAWLTMVTSIASTLILLQEVNAIIEINATLNNMETYSIQHEWVFWVVDALPIFLVLLGLAVVHPGRCLPSKYTRVQSSKGSSTSSKPPAKGAEIIYHPHLTPLMDHPVTSAHQPPTNAVLSNSSNEFEPFEVLGRLTAERLPAGTSGSDLWVWGPTRPHGYHEVSPYESQDSYHAYMRGAL